MKASELIGIFAVITIFIILCVGFPILISNVDVPIELYIMAWFGYILSLVCVCGLSIVLGMYMKEYDNESD